MVKEEMLFYPLYNDIMAKHIFGYQGRSKFLIHFLEDFLDLALLFCLTSAILPPRQYYTQF